MDSSLSFFFLEFFDLKARYEESDHLLARSLRFVTDKITELFGKLFSSLSSPAFQRYHSKPGSCLIGSQGSENELQKVLEEITKIDPNFTTEKFIRYCRLEVIPNVLEVNYGFCFVCVNSVKLSTVSLRSFSAHL